MQQYFIGLMSGTSLDGIDAVLVEFLDDHRINLVSALCHPWEKSLRQQITNMLEPNWTGSLKTMGELDSALGQHFAHAVNALLEQASIAPEQVSAIGSHGQTLWHQPDGTYPFTLQAGDPNQIAEHTNITVVADFRRRDMAAGGQGAPLVPAFHRAVFTSSDTHRTILNIGGIANITVLNPDTEATVWGFDTGPGNTLIDQWAFKYTGKTYDNKGEWARNGNIDQELLNKMLDDMYFKLPPPKSTGREHFNLGWIAKLRGQRELEAIDIQATLTELTAMSISAAITERAPETQEVIICGGGARNDYLLERIQHHSPTRTLLSTTDLGIDADWLEAIAFAWLAKRTLAGQSSNLPSVTGANGERILGATYPA